MKYYREWNLLAVLIFPPSCSPARARLASFPPSLARPVAPRRPTRHVPPQSSIVPLTRGSQGALVRRMPTKTHARRADAARAGGQGERMNDGEGSGERLGGVRRGEHAREGMEGGAGLAFFPLVAPCPCRRRRSSGLRGRANSWYEDGAVQM